MAGLGGGVGFNCPGGRNSREMPYYVALSKGINSVALDLARCLPDEPKEAKSAPTSSLTILKRFSMHGCPILVIIQLK